MPGLRGLLSDLTYQALRLRRAASPELRVLMYHRVTDAHPDDRLCVSVVHFEAQMRFLHEAGYRTVTVADAVRLAEGRGTSAGKAVAITFDDGYEDNFLSAAPTMARYGFTGCFFVPTQFIESDANRYTLADRPMGWEQLMGLLQSGHEVGAHSVKHVELTKLGAEAMRWEVEHSKAVLEQRLGRPVDFFCYPRGAYNAQVKAAVQAAGYRGACSVEPGAVQPGADPFTLRRTEVSAFDSLWDFEKKLAGAYDWMHAAVQVMKR